MAVLAVRHLRKTGGGPPIHWGGGSIGISGAARSGLLVARDPDDPSRRVLAGIKANLGALPQSLSFTVEGTEGEVARIVWHGPVGHRADELRPEILKEKDPGAHEEAEQFLRDFLSEGPVATVEVLRQARSMGIFPSAIRRARKSLHVKSKKDGFGRGAPWFLSLPEATIGGQESP